MDTEPLPSKPPGEEPDAIGLALRRSLMVLAALGLFAGGAVWWYSQPADPGRTQVTPLEAPRPPAADIRPPQVRFTGIGAAAGVDFVHRNGASGMKFLPETMGGGVAFLDFDGDGDADLLCVQSGVLAGESGGPAPTSRLYRNDTPPGGDWRFTDVTAGSGFDRPFYGMGAACGDYDGDGRTDVLLTGVGGVRLLHNEGGGRFTPAESALGQDGAAKDWTTAAAWFDMDNDGDLDLFVGRYVGWTPELDREVNNQLVGIGRAYGRPWNFPGTFPVLWRNDGPATDGTRGVRFTDVSKESGLLVRNPATDLPMAKTLSVAPIDLNDDGWMDLVVANDTVQNFVFTNRHDGTFREIGAQSGIAFDAYGQTRGAMGIDAARFRDDRALGIAIGNFANEMNALYVRQSAREQLVFADEAIPEGLGPASRLLLKFGLFFFDYDLDGRLDILTANGHIEEEIEKLQADVRYRQPAQLFWNAGTASTFTAAGSAECGPDLFTPVVGRGSAFADVDSDGDPDVAIAQINGPPLLLRNDQALGHNWIRVRLEDLRANREGIGAWVSLTTSDGRRLSRQVMPTKSYLSQSELPLTFGLGKATADTVEVRWTDGGVSRHEVRMGRLNVIRRER